MQSQTPVTVPSAAVPSTVPSVRRLAAAGAVAAALALAAAGPAAAHISVNPGEAEQGGYTTIDVKVPNERDNASTVKVEVTFPADHPLASVMPQPVPGWKVKVTKTEPAEPVEAHGRKLTEVPSRITWTETGGGIEPGTFQQFPVSVGKLPEDTDRLVLKAVQTYSNDEVVRWIEEPPAEGEGGEEPEHPAPVLNLVPPTEGGHGGDADAGDEPGTGRAADGTTTETTAQGEASGASDSSDTTARVLAVTGIAVGAAGVAFGVLAGRRRTTS
ncbi:YcnI family protein [Streptomyces verrucosisporus]|uniref:YcnI family protein n=1 Tax=Streptomyces verrucosisporus TaxID=1695161 RepID=UPI0019D221A6|nr:YcnI family protein [Streptomyces verrucosisporus]MBN3929368.1 YcnI family protein [Streptomyces verrucosisporus]